MLLMASPEKRMCGIPRVFVLFFLRPFARWFGVKQLVCWDSEAFCIQFLLTNRDLRRHTSSHLSATLYGFLFWMLKKKKVAKPCPSGWSHRCVILAKFTVLDHSRGRFIPLIDLDSWTYTPMFQKKGVKTLGFDCSLLQEVLSPKSHSTDKPPAWSSTTLEQWSKPWLAGLHKGIIL